MITIKDKLIINKEVKIISGSFKNLIGKLVGAHSESSIVVVRINGIDVQFFREEIVQE